MREQLTRKDVEKIEQEIEHRKLVVRKEASAGCVLSEKPSSVVPAGSAVFASIFSVSVFSLFWFCTLALICTIPVGITYTARFMARSPASICLYFFTYVTPPDFRSAA